MTDAKRRLASAVRPARVVLRKEIGVAVNEAVGPTQAGVQAELRDVRRILEDDMDAANEATAVFGRLLSQLGDRLDGIEELLQSIATRLDALEKPAKQAPRRPKAAPGGAPADPTG